MALLHIPLADITSAHLDQLVATGAAESLYIDYKRETYGGNDEQRREFLADVSSFANSNGGDIVIGMTEKQGIPKNFVPFTGDADAERLRLEQMARDGLQPRISDLRTRQLPIDGGSVIIIRVPKSYNPPHRVIYRGWNRFWARTSAGKYEPNVDELRNIFNAAPQLAEQLRSFRFERIARIANGETPVPLIGEREILSLHVVPFSALSSRQTLAMEEVERHWNLLAPMRRITPADHWVNFDGVVATSNPNEDAQQRAYVQVFRSGAIESVSVLAQNAKYNVAGIEEYLIPSAGRYANALRTLGIEPPYGVVASLLNMRGSSFRFAPEIGWSDKVIAADRDQYHLADVVFETVPRNEEEAAALLRPMLDHLAGLGGLSRSARSGNKE